MPRLRQGLFFLSLFLLALVPFAIIRFQYYNLPPLKIPVRYVILGIYFVIFSAYLFWINDRGQKEDSPRAKLLFFLIEAGLCFIWPVFSGDMMYYLMRGRILGATTWSQAKFRATVHKQWDISSYPFDRQRLEVQLEEGENDASAIHFVADNENSKIDLGVTLDW